jgi:hypothetical protein
MDEIAIVGNGELKQADLTAIGEANLIVRFNSPPPSHIHGAAKTDILVLSNSSKQTSWLLECNQYINGSIFRQAKSIILPYHPQMIAKYMPKPNPLSWLKGRRADLTQQCQDLANQHQKPCITLSPEAYQKACQALQIESMGSRRKFPSSGLLAVRHIVDLHAEKSNIRLFGFGFQGWKRHDWSREREYIENLAANQILNLNKY